MGRPVPSSPPLLGARSGPRHCAAASLPPLPLLSFLRMSSVQTCLKFLGCSPRAYPCLFARICPHGDKAPCTSVHAMAAPSSLPKQTTRFRNFREMKSHLGDPWKLHSEKEYYFLAGQGGRCLYSAVSPRRRRRPCIKHNP